MTPSIDFRLFLITDRARCAPRALDEVVREACAAGVRAVELRERDADVRELARLSAIAHAHGARLFVNARTLTAVGAAAATGVDGVHFPDHPHALNCAGSTLTVGRSVHSVAAARAAAATGVDYLLFSPVFAPISKATYAAPSGVGALAAVARAVDIPVFALGGITPDNARACIEAGAAGVALIGAIMAAEDVAAEVRRFEEALGGL
jgi:thiamine-phosphate pyrophosphorylase